MSIINHTNKWVFYHLEKTGGTTIRKVLPFDEENKTHMTPVEDVGHWQGYYKFCFVRNPWDRMVSWYEYMRDPEKMDDNYETIKEMSYLDFLRWRLPVPQQVESIYQNGKKCVDFIGRFESLQDDFYIICMVINEEFGILPKINSTKRKPFWEYYCNESKEMMREFFKDDIERFGYKYE